MKPSLFQLTLALIAGLVGALPSLGAQAFGPGEFGEYRLRWGLVTIGTVKLGVEAGEEEGTLDYHLVASTNSWMDRMFRARTRIISITPVDASHSLYYRRTEGETDGDDSYETLFDREALTARHSRNGDERSPIEIDAETQDPLSILYRGRALGLEDGATLLLPVTDGKAFEWARMEVRTEDGIDTPAGEFDTFRVTAFLGDVRGIFARPEDEPILVWVTRDSYLFPVRLRSKAPLGSFSAELVRYGTFDEGKLAEAEDRGWF